MERMRALSTQYPRYGYRRIRIFLQRDGHAMSVGRAHRLWRLVLHLWEDLPEAARS